MRLFSAVLPPPAVLDHLAVALDSVPDVDRVPRDSWHITLGYYGADDAHSRTEWLREQVSGLSPARIGLSGSGVFGRTAWIGVSAMDSAFAALGSAARWNDKWDWHPHLTVGKGTLALDYSGPEWTVEEIVLIGAAARYEYTVVDRVALSGIGLGRVPFR